MPKIWNIQEIHLSVKEIKKILYFKNTEIIILMPHKYFWFQKIIQEVIIFPLYDKFLKTIELFKGRVPFLRKSV